MSKQLVKDDEELRAGRRKVIFLFILLGFVFAFGTLGYMLIEGWSPFDAFYMTVVTLSTIGYGEVHELSKVGRAFTILLIFLGLGIFTVMVGSVSQAVLEGQFNRIFK